MLITPLNKVQSLLNLLFNAWRARDATLQIPEDKAEGAYKLALSFFFYDNRRETAVVTGLG